jgi:hypothetical protein
MTVKKNFSSICLHFFLVVVTAAIWGCSDKKIRTVEEMQAQETLLVATPTGHYFEVPADRYQLNGKKIHDRYGYGNIEMHKVSTDSMRSAIKNFETRYTEGYKFSKKETINTIFIKGISAEARLIHSKMVINGHRRNVTYAYIPEIKLLTIFYAHGKTGGHDEIVKMWQITMKNS